MFSRRRNYLLIFYYRKDIRIHDIIRVLHTVLRIRDCIRRIFVSKRSICVFILKTNNYVDDKEEGSDNFSKWHNIIIYY